MKELHWNTFAGSEQTHALMLLSGGCIYDVTQSTMSAQSSAPGPLEG